jgi:ABC-type lipoprotein release transport system permease subunit
MNQYRLYFFLTLKLLFQFDPNKKLLKVLVLPLFSIFLVAFCVFIPLLALSVTNGFHQFIESTLNNFYQKYTVNLNQNIDRSNLSLPSLSVGYYEDYIFLSHHTFSKNSLLRAYDQKTLSQIKIATGKTLFSQKTLPLKGEIAISESLANQLLLHPKDTVVIYSFNPESFTPITRSLMRVKSIISFSNASLDSQVIIVNNTSLPQFFNLSSHIINHISSDNPNIRSFLKKDPSYSLIKTNKLNSFKTMDSQKILLQFILLTISFICFFSVFITLNTSIMSQQRNITLLRLLGVKKLGVTIIFFLQGLIIGILGVVIGLSLTILLTPHIKEILTFIEYFTNIWVSLIQQIAPTLISPYYHFALMPSDVFYITSPPIQMLLSDFIIQTSLIIFTICIAAFIPTIKLFYSTPLSQLKFKS